MGLYTLHSKLDGPKTGMAARLLRWNKTYCNAIEAFNRNNSSPSRNKLQEAESHHQHP